MVFDKRDRALSSYAGTVAPLAPAIALLELEYLINYLYWNLSFRLPYPQEPSQESKAESLAKSRAYPTTDTGNECLTAPSPTSTTPTETNTLDG